MADAEVRIDELARRAGVATTTVRLYQRRGLLPGPRLEGRVGWYGPAHLDRLRLIAELQADGHSLAGIGRLVEGWERGAALDDVVGREAGLAALLGSAREVVLTPAELAERMPVEGLTPTAMARAVDIGLVEPLDDGRLRIPDARFLEAGPALMALGVPVDVVLDEWERLQERSDEVAGRFLAVFEEHVVPAVLGAGEGHEAPGALDDLGPEQLAVLGEQLGRLHHLAGQVVQAGLDASLARLARQRLSALVDPS